MRARPAVTERNAVSRAAKREGGAPAATERHGARILDRPLEASRGKRRDHLLPLPGEIGVRLHMLEGAAPAGAEILADRRDTLGARIENGKRLSAGLSWLGRHLHQLAGKREGDEERPVRTLRHAVALGAKALDPDLKLHGSRRSELPRCRFLPEWGRASRRTRSSLASH